VKKRVYFDVFDGRGWPAPSELQHYFLAPPGQRWTFLDGDNDCWGLKAEGIDGTEHLPLNEGRVDLDLTMLGNPDHGVLLHYHKWGGERAEMYYSRGDLRRLREWVWTVHGSLMPVGLFIPFERAWLAVKEFMETDGALPKNIEWIAAADIPEDAFPDPYLVARKAREAATRK
jgi:hypothetical protein